MLGIVIPAYNEQDDIEACLSAADEAARHPCLGGEDVRILVVLDSCTDNTAMLVAKSGFDALAVNARNVGEARAAGAAAHIASGARWLAFTDADTQVAPDWLVQQLALNADAVCGTVSVDDWTPHGKHGDLLRWHFHQTYTDADGHSHIHGANLGVSSEAYRGAGGFQHLACSEDVALIAALEAIGASIAWSARPRVVTSARRIGRTAGGFAAALNQAIKSRLAERSLKFDAALENFPLQCDLAAASPLTQESAESSHLRDQRNANI